MFWHLVLFIDSAHPSHSKLCRVTNNLLPGPASIFPRQRPLGRFYCSVWYNLDEEELKPFFFRLLDGNLKACRKYILELEVDGVEEAVARCMTSAEEIMQQRKKLAETMWVELKTRQLKEADFGD